MSVCERAPSICVQHGPPAEAGATRPSTRSRLLDMRSLQEQASPSEKINNLVCAGLLNPRLLSASKLYQEQKKEEIR